MKRNEKKRKMKERAKGIMKRTAGGEKSIFPALFPRLDLTEVFHISGSNPGRWVEGGTCLCCSSLSLQSPSPSFLRAWLLKAGWQDIYSHPNPLANHSPLRIILQHFTTFCEPFTPMKHSPLSREAIVYMQFAVIALQCLLPFHTFSSKAISAFH